MKNLDWALGLLAEVQARVHFTIYGPLEDAQYWTRCKDLIGRLPANVRAEYRGEVPPEDVVKTIAKHHVFFLPSRGENFGHVVHEALAAGVPVLLSDRTPWRNLADLGIGWDLPLRNRAAFIEVFENVAGWSSEEWERWRARARKYAQLRVNDSENLAANRTLLLRAVCPDRRV